MKEDQRKKSSTRTWSTPTITMSMRLHQASKMVDGSVFQKNVWVELYYRTHTSFTDTRHRKRCVEHGNSYMFRCLEA